jgi:PPE-repeat protein
MDFSVGISGFGFSGTGGFSGAGGGIKRTVICFSGCPNIPSLAANHASKPMTTT